MKKLEQEALDLMHKNLDNWKGILYINRKDPRVLVPKLNPLLGTTLNFGNPYAYLGIILIILIIAVSQFFIW